MSIVTLFSRNSMQLVTFPIGEALVRYNCGVNGRSLLLCALLSPLASMNGLTAQTPPSPAALAKGIILDRVVTANHPDQSYALYLPSDYSPDRFWPVVFSFDPGAHGKTPVELQKEAAERYGYILAASNNSRNGPGGQQAEAADAMVQDAWSRFPLDNRRIYFAGFSGGARVAAALALHCKCAAGVLLSGAGFPIGVEPSRDAAFPVFSAVGVFDFNYSEVLPLQDKLNQAGYAHWLRVFDGQHQWAPAEVMQEALEWFQVQAQKSRSSPRDAAFLNAQFAKDVARANSLEQSGNLLNAWRENLQIAATFDGLLDVTAIRGKADSLGREKSVREGAKRERSEFDEQAQLTARITGGLLNPVESSPANPEDSTSLEDEVRQLHSRALAEKRPDHLRVYSRAVGNVAVASMESGSRFLEIKDYPSAIRSFRCATEAAPEFATAWSNLAVAYSLVGRKKETFAALRHARDVGKDPAAFADWALKEPALERWRSLPEFQALFNPH